MTWTAPPRGWSADRLPPTLLADDAFVRRIRKTQHDWAGRPNRQSRRRSATFIATYQDRLSALAELARPCLVIGFELDTDTYAARAREVAEALSEAQYVELAGLAHAASISHPDQVWPPVVYFLRRNHPPCIAAATGSGVPGPIAIRRQHGHDQRRVRRNDHVAADGPRCVVAAVRAPGQRPGSAPSPARGRASRVRDLPARRTATARRVGELMGPLAGLSAARRPARRRGRSA